MRPLDRTEVSVWESGLEERLTTELGCRGSGLCAVGFKGLGGSGAGSGRLSRWERLGFCAIRGA